MYEKINESTKEEIFDKLLELMNAFKGICEENNLKYSLMYGTMLGAIRHKGFIPWDDDVDIAMLRKDYDKLVELAKNGKIKEPYFVQCPDTDPGTSRMYLKFRDSSTTSVSLDDYYLNFNHGIFLDVFPLDYYPKGKIKRFILVKLLKLINKLSRGYSRFYSKTGTKNDKLSVKILYIFTYPFYKFHIITGKKLFHLFNGLFRKVNNKENCTEICSSAWLATKKNDFYPKEWVLNGYINCKYENLTFTIFKEYDKLLTNYYGDYMTPVKDEAGHSLIQIVDKPYSEFIEENLDYLNQLRDEEFRCSK